MTVLPSATAFKGVRSGSFVAVPHDDTRMQCEIFLFPMNVNNLLIRGLVIADYFYSIVLKVTDRCGNYDIVRRSATMIGFQDKP